jgi:hypothetical protein
MGLCLKMLASYLGGLDEFLRKANIISKKATAPKPDLRSHAGLKEP